MMARKTRLVVAILAVLAVAAAAWNGGGWLIHKFKAMHGIH